MRKILLIHYSEIGTKGKNRSYFERRLRDDIQRRLFPQHVSNVRIESCRLLADLTPQFNETAIAEAMNQVFGVAWYALASITERDWPTVSSSALEQARNHPDAKTFKVYCTRADKTYPLSSQEICKRLGQTVVDQLHLAVNLEHHDLAIHVEILRDSACLYTEKRAGLRGMPRASAGRLLCLFSGGIDSPVAAWMLMRRGAIVHFLHFHPFRRAEELKDSKIFGLYKILRSYNSFSKLYLIPHYPFQVRAALDASTAYETVLFRRFMFQTAVELARRRRMKGLIAGDSLGQVASQTLENLAAAQADLMLPLFLPLIAYDKDDIVRAAQKIGTFSLSTQPYKDCCSLMSRHPKTTVSVERIRELERKLDFPTLIVESLQCLEIWDGEKLTSTETRPSLQENVI